jgi:hypothetical protein
MTGEPEDMLPFIAKHWKTLRQSVAEMPPERIMQDMEVLATRRPVSKESILTMPKDIVPATPEDVERLKAGLDEAIGKARRGGR